MELRCSRAARAGNVSVLLALTLALGACGGGGGGDSSAAGNDAGTGAPSAAPPSTAPPSSPSSTGSSGSTAANQAPSIAGDAQPEAMVNQSYRFTPTAGDPDGDPLTFSVANKPGWLAFDPTTGTLSGTPAAADVGSYASITITVSDGAGSAELPAFGIDVVSTATRTVTLTWTAPTQNEDGSPLTDLAGYKIRFGGQSGSYPNVVDLGNPGLLTYVVTDLVPSTYYFVVSAYNSSGVESRYSNEASVVLN